MKLKINRNQVLLVIGFLAFLGPEIKSVAEWLAGSGIPHLEGVVRVLGWLATALGGLALAWNRLRPLLASFGLATPPGAVAPWIPGKPGDPAGAQPAPAQPELRVVQPGAPLPRTDDTPVTVPLKPKS